MCRRFQQQFGANVYGVTDRNMWKGMVAFDRPTWIQTLNRKSTFFLTGQFIVRLGQNYFLAAGAGSTPAFETWSLGGVNRGRSQTLLRVTYQF